MSNTQHSDIAVCLVYKQLDDEEENSKKRKTQIGIWPNTVSDFIETDFNGFSKGLKQRTEYGWELHLGNFLNKLI